jgi:hypothetical protein
MEGQAMSREQALDERSAPKRSARRGCAAMIALDVLGSSVVKEEGPGILIAES